MLTFGITFVVTDPNASLDVIEQNFYSKFDGVLSRSAGRVLITVYGDGVHGPATAMRLARDLEFTLQITIDSVDQDLVDTGEISRRVSRSRQNIRQFAMGERGPQGFPAPLGSPGGKRIWDWASVSKWLCRHSYLEKEEHLLSREETSIVNSWLFSRKGGQPTEIKVDFAGVILGKSLRYMLRKPSHRRQLTGRIPPVREIQFPQYRSPAALVGRPGSVTAE
jgi:hypothetical protein